MRTVESILTEELYQLKKIVGTIKKELDKAPRGMLRIRNAKGKVEYYYRDTVNGIMVGSEMSAKRVMRNLTRFIEEKLGRK